MSTPTIHGRSLHPPLRPEDRAELAPVLASAKRAHVEWAAFPLHRRLQVVRRFRHLLAGRAGELAAAVHRVDGTPAAQTLVAEVLPLADAARFLEREAEAVLRPRRLGAAGRPAWLWGSVAEVRREPLGLVLVIGPSNYPVFLPGVQALQALVAGNAVALKPAPGTGAVARLLAELLTDAGLDPRLLAILPEAPAVATEAIAAGVDQVVLTGSAETGAAVLGQLAPHLVPAVLELSGCDAAVVRADADLDLVTKAIEFAFRLKAGRTCIAPHRIFVARPLAAALEERLCAVARQLPAAPCPHVDRLAPLLADAVQGGARWVAGRLLAETHEVAPVVVADARPEMALLQADLFAPLVALVPVADDREAIEAANRCPFALGATVFGGEWAARAVAAQLRAGVVVVNDMIVPTADPRLPFGGRGRSGFGATRGPEGLLALTAPKVIITRRGRARPHLDQLGTLDPALVEAFLKATHGPTWVGRLAGWWDVARSVRNTR